MQKLFLFLLMIVSLISLAVAKDFKPYNTEIAKIEQALNGVNTMQSSFVQQNPDGTISTGNFYLSRPGKLRWDYNSPTPILIVVSGSVVAYYDRELDELSHISISDTIAGFLTKEQISFSENDVKIVDIVKKTGTINISLTQKEDEEQGKLTLVFATSDSALLGMEVVDSIGKTTIIKFKDSVYNKPILKELFLLPKVKPKRR